MVTLYKSDKYKDVEVEISDIGTDWSKASEHLAKYLWTVVPSGAVEPIVKGIFCQLEALYSLGFTEKNFEDAYYAVVERLATE